MIQIRHSLPADLPVLMDLYERGRRIMRSSGNLNQWTHGYPTEDIVKQDIAHGNSYLCLDETGQPVGTFAFIVGADPTYARIYDGQWLDDTQPYGTIHRLAGRADTHGLSAACLEWCYAQVPNLRADTHRDNRIMQHILLKHGFRYCGIIYLQNGDERLAYQKL
ncbi:MAG TPA: GNAT family N-acetyltransferase [Candidatus Bacteroides merdigallinarum]|uniref:GNAT family N-acetyltransferase n=1 Tax=Candidatus Bacteroides merdigallinarum TaxID=2838473 RepID=A0A9D2EAU8_9BACE|nr:GNAT family N-acetyltransferase [Candidatus Bacteroides merdigallinarum]